MLIRKIVVKLCFLVLLPLCNYGQSDFAKHKNRYLALAKQIQSIRRDTLMIIELDSLMLCINYADRKEVKEFDETYIRNLLKTQSQLSNWEKGTAIYNLWNGVHKFTYTGEHIKSFQFLAEAESQFEKLKDYDHQALTLTRMGLSIIYNFKGVFNELKYIEKAILVAKKANNKRHLFNALNAKGEYYYTKNEFKNALKVYREYDILNDPKKINNQGNKLNTGFTLLQLDSLDEALSLINSTLEKIPVNSLHEKYLHWETYKELISYYIRKKNFKEAKKYLPKLIKFSYDKAHLELYPNYVYKVEKGLKNYQAALEALEKHQLYLLEDKREIEQNNIEGMKSQAALHEQAEKLQKAELEKLRSENANQNQARWFWTILSVIGILSTIYVLQTNKQLRQYNESLLNKNAQISVALLQGQTIERQRVAIDLHDNLGSTLSALWLNVDMIDKSKMNDEEKEIHQNLRENLEKAYNDVRLLSHNLLPEEFEKQGLVPTLHGLVRKISKNSKIRFDLQVADDFGRVHNKIEFELYSICLELVNNIIKHSKATEAKISLSRTEKQIKLIVSDNGIGTFKNESDGKGMKNVKARVDSLNGIWIIDSKENQGTNSQINIPI
ncbi:tetratricopeptide repeat-containing sensor histidine kinase [Emticicia sp. SJ17W-69]|uniref:tetratricopeptide repeat-containing sensor histidine kinase n=1 Tax=Emticicia sp. SJ17W-69 TaxID=3421657 RepID=UPI003EB86574